MEQNAVVMACAGAFCISTMGELGKYKYNIYEKLHVVHVCIDMYLLSTIRGTL